MKTTTIETTRRISLPRIVLLALALLAGAADAGQAQWARTHEQFYLPASHNWVFRREYPGADRLFNAFDYGHAILYERLYTRPGAPVAELEEREYDFITRRLLVSPPRLPLEEGAIEIAYVKLAPEAKLMFEWAHLLHRQIYDVLADERLSEAQRDTAVAELLRYYRSRPDLAFSSRPKNMELMEGQYYATAFREGYPKFNGLIWAYHWLQVGLYEPLLVGRTREERQTGVSATVTRFRQMLENAPENMPRVMPMTAAIAPRFAARYPEAAIIFDNLHGMHDVISDILASPKVPRDRKRAEILLAAQRYRDDTSFVMTEAEWREMTEMMGVQNMGGPVTGFLAGFPQPTVARGAVMAHGTGTEGHAAHGATHAPEAAPPAPSAADHGAMGHGDAAPPPADPHAGMRHAGAKEPSSASALDRLRELRTRLLADAAVRARVDADTDLRRMQGEMRGAPSAAADSVEGAFLVRLLADPAVEARIHGDARLHALWSDPDVQRLLADLRRRHATAPSATPHQHQH
jgi:hypothetical protein